MWMKFINHISNYIGAVPVMISGIITAIAAGLLSIVWLLTGGADWMLVLAICGVSYSVVMVLSFFMLFMLGE